MIAKTPEPPYYAVIFTNTINENLEGYADTATRMVELAEEQEGFLGFESARDGIGISVSYWKDLESIRLWKANSEHLFAQEKGKSEWYKSYTTRIAKVEREYSFDSGV
ncbi:antibiotic biosynthesis monooxygenase family protein [Sediminitomix flava]|uniref:Heme-degrading monooxygenase HmoA n=1 Tax=Sediminitomix flava TaxID=379075 RepID=A0A315Z6S8_SEDFL|nr:antibiotic biosynthesis monooxygenase [Sediminitomix flava]PWJ40097.1 heme-degrading monooxygenase HmoA [Sediminitomix flava]